MGEMVVAHSLDSSVAFREFHSNSLLQPDRQLQYQQQNRGEQQSHDYTCTSGALVSAQQLHLHTIQVTFPTVVPTLSAPVLTPNHVPTPMSAHQQMYFQLPDSSWNTNSVESSYLLPTTPVDGTASVALPVRGQMEIGPRLLLTTALDMSAVGPGGTQSSHYEASTPHDMWSPVSLPRPMILTDSNQNAGQRFEVQQPYITSSATPEFYSAVDTSGLLVSGGIQGSPFLYDPTLQPLPLPTHHAVITTQAGNMASVNLVAPQTVDSIDPGFRNRSMSHPSMDSPSIIDMSLISPGPRTGSFFPPPPAQNPVRLETVSEHPNQSQQQSARSPFVDPKKEATAGSSADAPLSTPHPIPTPVRRPRANTIPGSKVLQKPVPPRELLSAALSIQPGTTIPTHLGGCSTSGGPNRTRSSFSNSLRVQISSRNAAAGYPSSPSFAAPHTAHPLTSGATSNFTPRISNKDSPGLLLLPIPPPPSKKEEQPQLTPNELLAKLDDELVKIDFEDITVTELKELLRQRGLPSSGKKAALVGRLHTELEVSVVRRRDARAAAASLAQASGGAMSKDSGSPTQLSCRSSPKAAKLSVLNQHPHAPYSIDEAAAAARRGHGRSRSMSELIPVAPKTPPESQNLQAELLPVCSRVLPMVVEQKQHVPEVVAQK
ncbi:hypothetical protein BJ742DRAFT_484211 [Cladochytrium replicatum]|nr:hypothetical protein BJ742DRAFT_484211 [Cladochytrium replicatum]